MSISKLRLALLAFASLTGAGVADAAPCETATLSAYTALGSAGCSVGALTFSDFLVDLFPGPTAQQIAADSVSLTPLSNGFAISSRGVLSAAADDLLGLRFLFHVEAPALTGATVLLGSGSSAAGDGVITGLFDAGAAGNAIAFVIDGLDESSASFASSPMSDYDAFLELGIDGGTFGSAALGPQLASLTFVVAAPVPEPSIAVLSLAGLIGAAALRRRRKREA